MSEPRRPWYEEAFNREYLEVYAHRDEEDARRALRLFEEQGVIRPRDRILDLACGDGRHSLMLCRRGHRVVGLDLSHELLLEFRLSGDCDVPLVRGDMRHVPHREGVFDVVLSLFTSFGYFEDDEDDWQVIREIARVLRPGGRFVLDFLNELRVRAELRPHSERELASGVHVTESRRIDADRRRVVKTVELRRGGELLRRWHEAVRLHTRLEIERTLHDSGLTQVRAFGDFDASPHSESSPRLILMATRA